MSTSTPRFTELQLSLQRRDAESYLVDLRFSTPGSDEELSLPPGELALVRIDLPALQRLEPDPVAYGQALAGMLFAPPPVASLFARARAITGEQRTSMRLRLAVGASAPELHAVRWETLRDPERDSPLLTGQEIFFSRYLSGSEWRPVRLRPFSAMRALIAIANPDGLASYRLNPIAVDEELARAQASLAAFAPQSLAAPGQATLETIIARAGDGCDLLYLVCHGTFVEGEPWLWLEDEAGAVAHVAGTEFANRLRELRERPRLVVLASCQSAASSDTLTADGSALTALGPRLAEAGIPAVIAMQGRISVATLATFMPEFFAQLGRHGQIDQAMAAARGLVRDHADSWMPALFMRLRSGAIGYTPGFAEGAGFEKWPSLVRNINDGVCTPVLGPHLGESILGSPRELAQRWAATYHFPMAAYQREDLPQVAQYIAVQQDEAYPRRALGDALRQDLLARYGAQLPPELAQAPLRDLVARVGELRRAAHPADPYRTLAGMPFRIFVIAGTDNLLVEALRAAGKQPVVEICRWHEDLQRLPSALQKDPDYEPSPERPLIFYLFGVNSVPESLVLTEDDYFDYLLGVARNNALIPPVVRAALVDTALLFLGFRLDDWSFRVLLRSILNRQGSNRRMRYANIAGQIMPEDESVQQPERARSYLEKYFGKVNISIYWGSVDDFMHELNAQYTPPAASQLNQMSVDFF